MLQDLPAWKPQKKQTIALQSQAFETLFGGARGGGKTDAGLAWLLYPIEHSRYRGLVIRKNETDLRDWLDRAERMYSGMGVRFVGRPVQIQFPSGAVIYTGHLKDDQAYTKYQGHEYQRMLIEELTHIPTEDAYLKLISSCRSTIEVKPMIFATSNPGGSGHSWVKKRFMPECTTPMTPFPDKISGRTRVYIPARVYDNVYLMEKDPDYVKSLDALPPDLRAQWLDGSWEDQIIKGSIFGEDLERIAKKGQIGTVPLWDLQEVQVAFDIGLSDDQTMWFYQVKNREVRIIDCAAFNGKPFDFYPQFLKEKGYKYGEIILPHDAVKRAGDTLRSFRDVMEEHGFKCRINSRTKDKQRDIQSVRTLLAYCWFNSETCAEGIEALRNYRREWDEPKATYKDTPLHDGNSHYADAFQALAVSLPPFMDSDSRYEEAAQKLIGNDDEVLKGAKLANFKKADEFFEEQQRQRQEIEEMRAMQELARM